MTNILDLVQENTDNIQDLVFEDCLLKKGLYLEIYCNPDGIYYDNGEYDEDGENEEDIDTSNGFSLFILIDKDITYHELLELDIYEGCKIKDNEVRIDIITKNDPFNRLSECSFAPLSNMI